ncbi:hypothetical protein MycrhDRAFT_2871 [Mycolicibacterium rhodesiae JS60]|nr:hypothetical protein MycrhDRAFT_2871 [Mycolicibacterium rhodesiae JS60]
MSGDGGLLRVDPAALSGAGSAVAEVSNGVATAVGAVTASYNANTGQDAAGTAFGFAYQDSAGELVKAVATGVNALRHIGYLIQGSATNYSRAEAAADIGGGAAPLAAPTAPAEFPAPAGDPDVNGPGETPPVLWYLVEFLVGDWWPNGSPGELRAAAAAWSVFATPLYCVAGQIAGPCGVIDAQQMPDKEPMKKAVLDAGSAMSSLAGEAQKLAGELTSFATDVETTQDAIRDLLDKLSSVVGSIVDKGVLGTVFELVTGDAEERIHEVANDIKAVIANHKRQSAARKELLADLVTGVKNYSRAMEIITRVELVNYLGEDAGRITANVFDAFTDTNVGVALGGINTVGSIASIDPIGDPKGTWEMIKGLNRMAEILNPMTAPMAFATDPQGSLDMVKDLTHYDDITSDRPFLGIGELGFDIGTAIIPGGAGVKAAGGARAAEGAAARAEISATERAAGEAGGIASATGGLRGVSRDLEGVTAKLDDLNRTGLDGGKPPSGSPGPLPKPGEPGPPPGGKPTSGPQSGAPASPPVTHLPHAGPTAPVEPHSAPGPSEPASAAPGAVSHDPGAPSGGDGQPHSSGGGNGGEPPHNGAAFGNLAGDQPHNPPHTGLYDPPANHGVPGERLPDLTDINNEYRLPGGAVDPARFDEWTEKVAEKYEPISPRGVGGVYDYSSELHQGMNPYLRDVDSLTERQQGVLGVDSLSDLTPEQRALWEERIAHTDEGLAALPPYRADPSDLTSTTWRGMRGSDSLLGQLHEGDIFHDPGYLSTTSDSFVAESFARGALPGETPTLVKVIGSDGVDVSQLSEFMHESEILFPRGSEFEIVSRQAGDDGILRITMRQVK